MDSVIQFEGTIYENGYGLLAQKVMRDKSLPKQSKLIYAYMCSFASVGKNGERTAFPSVSLQCAELGLSEDTYYKWRKKLIEKGYIRITKQRKEGSKFDNNIYSILAVPAPTETEEKPYPKNSGMEEKPYPKNSGTENSGTENSGTIINSSIINNFIIKKEEEEEGAAPSTLEIPKTELVTFLIESGIKEENAIKFENRVLKENLVGFDNEQVLKAIEWALWQFKEGKCNEPYIYAVGRLKRMLDGKLNEVKQPSVSDELENAAKTQKKYNRPRSKFGRVEAIPEWFEKQRNGQVEEITTSGTINYEEERQRILAKLGM